jgi:hypothetical protein
MQRQDPQPQHRCRRIVGRRLVRARTARPHQRHRNSGKAIDAREAQQHHVRPSRSIHLSRTNRCAPDNTARNNVRPRIPLLLQHTTALPALGLGQQACILLQHCNRLRGPDHGAHRPAGAQVHGAGTEAQDPDDLSEYVLQLRGDGIDGIWGRKGRGLTSGSSEGREAEANGIR